MATINLQLNVDKSQAFTGDTFTYTILYANPSTTENAQNIIIKDTLPSQLVYVSYISSPDVQSISVTRLNNQDVISFTMNSPLAAGTTGMLRITAKFPIGTTTELVNGQPNVAVNSVEATGSNIVTTYSNSVTVTPKNVTPNWTVTKYKTSPTATPTVASIIEYGIDVTGNTNQNGALNLSNVSVVDTLPTGAQFISASSGGVYSNQQVSWNLGNITVGSKKTVTVKIQFPPNTVTTSSTVTNSVEAYATPLGLTQQTKTTTYSHGFSAVSLAIGSIVKSTRTSSDKYSVGQTIDYLVTGIKNQSNVSIDRFELRDTFPIYYRFTSLSTGSFSNGNYTLNLYYQTNLNSTEQLWVGCPYTNPNDVALTVTSLGLATNEYVTTIRYELTNGVDGFDVNFIQNKTIHLYGTVLTPPTLPYTLPNTVTLYGYKTNYTTLTKSSTRNVTIINPMPWLEGVKKTTNNISNYNPNSTVTYIFAIKNHAWATGNYVDPIAIDVLPVQLENITLVSVSTTNAPNLTATPTVDLNYTVVMNNVTYPAIKVLATGTLYPGEYITVTYQAKIKSDALNGSFTNDVYIATQNVTTTYQNTNVVSDIYDLNKNGLVIDKWVKFSYSTYVNFVGSLTSVKWVKGELDTNYSKYPDIGQTLPGGKANYKLQVINNNSNGPISNIVIIDIFPYVGDIGVIDPQPRLSAWTPYLINKITGPDGTTLPTSTLVYYSTQVNLSKTELTNPSNTPNTSDGWSVTPPADITTVRSIKIDFTTLTLNPGEEVILEWTMRAPVSAEVGTIAWNSFGYNAKYPTTSGAQAFLPSEPFKVGFTLQPSPSGTGTLSEYVWFDRNYNGIQNVNEPGINGIRVNLYRVGEPTSITYTRTGNNLLSQPGYAQFPNLTPGDYYLEYIYPQTYFITKNNVGTNPEINSNVIESSKTETTDLGIAAYSVLSPTFTVYANTATSRGFGLYTLTSITGTVFKDLNYNGIKEVTDPILSSVTVNLLYEDGTPVLDNNLNPLQISTSSQGTYLFANLKPNTYMVEVINPAPTLSIFTQYMPLSTFVIQNNLHATGKSDPVLSYASETTSINGGIYYVRGTISGFIWDDLNMNGLLDNNEPELYDVPVKLLNLTNQVLATTLTNTNGYYEFNQLDLGQYLIYFYELPQDYIFTTPFIGSNPYINSKAITTTGKTPTISITLSNFVIDTMNAGIYFLPLPSIEGYIHVNPAMFNTPAEAEQAKQNVEVYLIHDGQIYATTFSDSQGYYEFRMLPYGTFTVLYTIPETGQSYSQEYCFPNTVI